MTAVLAGLAGVAAGGAAVYVLVARPAAPDGRPAAPPAAGDRVSALGRVVPAGGVIPVYGPPGDRLAKVADLAPGKVLKAGDTIATLASEEQRAGEVKVAEAQLNEAKAGLAASREAGAKKIDAAKAEADRLAAGEAADLAALDARIGFAGRQKEVAAKQVERMSGLRAKGIVVADEDFEKARLLVDQAEAEGKAAAAAREKAEAGYRTGKAAAAARETAARAELAEAEAKAPVKSAEERLAVAKKARELVTLKAPVDGVVLKVGGRAGQPTGMEPVVQMAALTDMTVVAEVYESDLGRVGEWLTRGPVTAEATNPALPRPLSGVVRSDADVTRMIARNQAFPVGPREDSDRRVVEVVAHLDAGSAAAAARFVGLQVSVTLTPGR